MIVLKQRLFAIPRKSAPPLCQRNQRLHCMFPSKLQAWRDILQEIPCATTHSDTHLCAVRAVRSSHLRTDGLIKQRRRNSSNRS